VTSNEADRIRKLLQDASPAERVVPVILKAGLARQIEDLEKQLLEARSVSDTLAGSPEARRIAAQIDELIAEAKDSTVEVTIRQLPRKVWSDLKKKHPPADPRMYLYDVAIFEDAVPLSWAAPEVDDDTRDKLLEQVNDGQWEKLCQAVQVVNGDVSVPFSALATQILRNSGGSEQQPEPTE
jgi:hypothetical protein